jgi:transcriptional regulator with XRE-family HTH domain
MDIKQLRQTIGKNIRCLRTGSGMTQSDVSRHLNITYQQFQKYESGKSDITAGKLVILARLFEVNLSDFFKKSKSDFEIKYQTFDFEFFKNFMTLPINERQAYKNLISVRSQNTKH